MAKSKQVIVAVIVAVALFFGIIVTPAVLTRTVMAHAEEITETTEETVEEQPEIGEETSVIDEVVEEAGEVETTEETPIIVEETEQETPIEEVQAFDYAKALIDFLRDKYGAEYEKYYNAIIVQYGTAKEYFDSIVAEKPDETVQAWGVVKNWLDEYANIWQPILATVALIGAVLLAKFGYNKVNGLFVRSFKGANASTSALIALCDAQITLLGNNPKNAEQKVKIEKAKEELMKDV